MIGLQAYLSGQEFPGTNSHIDMEGGLSQFSDSMVVEGVS